MAAVRGPDRPRPRHVTFGLHVVIEFLFGVGLAISPLVWDFDQGATIAAIVLGVLVATVAITTGVAGPSISPHHSWDRGLVLILAVATVAAAIGDGASASTAVFAVMTVLEAGLTYVTRYVPDTG